MSWLDLNLSLEKSARRAEILSSLGKYSYSYSSIRVCAFSHLLAIAFVAWALISIRASDVTPWALKEMMPSDNFSLWPASRPLSLARFCNLLRIWVFSRLVKKRRVGWLMFLRDRVWRLLCFLSLPWLFPEPPADLFGLVSCLEFLTLSLQWDWPFVYLFGLGWSAVRLFSSMHEQVRISSGVDWKAHSAGFWRCRFFQAERTY